MRSHFHIEGNKQFIMILVFGVIYVVLYVPAVLQVNVCKNIALKVLNFELFKVMLCWAKLYSSPNIVRVIKSRRMRWAGHVARMG